MKWLAKFLDKPRVYSVGILTLLLAVYWSIAYFQIGLLIDQFTHKVNLAVDDSYPTLEFREKNVKINGTIPFIRRYSGNAYAIFDTTHTINRLPDNADNGSYLITSDSIQFRYKNKIKSFPFQDIELDDFVLSPQKIRKISNWLNGPFQVLLGLAGFFLIWPLALLLAVIGSGIIFMIDTFANGSLGSRQAFHLAILAMVPMWLFYTLQRILHFSIPRPLLTFALMYLLLLVIVTLSAKNLNVRPVEGVQD